MAANVPLRGDFDDTLKLVRKLRAQVREEPVVVGRQGTHVTHPAYKILADQEKHLRGLSRLIGPARVAIDIEQEFKDASAWVKELMILVMEDPTIEGQRDETKNPLATIMGNAQTHIRGCAAILETAKAVIKTSGDDSYDRLFNEPSRS